MDEPFGALYDAVLTGDDKAAAELAGRCLDAGSAPQELLDRSMVPAMSEAGRLFEEEEYFVPELLLSARAMKAAMALIRPLLVEADVEHAGRIVIGTVQGDLHDIGKNLVAAMLEGAGFDVIDLGADVSPDEFVQAVKDHGAGLVGLSALLTVTMPSMRATVEALESAGLRGDVKVLVGGAPLSESAASELGADAYADNANAAVRSALALGGKG